MFTQVSAATQVAGNRLTTLLTTYLLSSLLFCSSYLSALKLPTASAGTGSDYQSGFRGTGATGTASNINTGSSQGTALTSGSHIPGEQGNERRGQQVPVCTSGPHHCLQ